MQVNMIHIIQALKFCAEHYISSNDIKSNNYKLELIC